MSFTKSLEKYADLLVTVGLNLKPSDKLAIRLTEDALPLARCVSQKAYQKGVLDVKLDFSDDEITLARYLNASDEAFTTFPEYEVDYREKLFQDNYHILSLASPNPELLKSVDPVKIATWQKTAGKASKRLQHYTMQNKNKWCVAAVACKAWAKAAFPDMPEKLAVQKLWKNIFAATRVDQRNPVKAWKQHDKALKLHEKFLNNARFEKLHFKGPGTDLEVFLVKGHRWVGGSGVSVKGDVFMANIPTEEIFSMPHADKVNGTIRATLPLSVRGQIVDKFHFTFKDGKVVDFDAQSGKQILADLLDMDDGAKRLGEVALVAHNSPISNTGILFKNTLFDENASCHFALGAAYSENLPGSAERPTEENRQLGMNDSLIHVDFMVGGADVSVTGIKADGTKVILLQDGEWQV